MFKPSGNPKVEELTKSVRTRTCNLSYLKAIKLPELNDKGNPRRLCAWCAVVEIFSRSQKYCSTECSNCAMAWAYPQKEDALRFLLLRQDWKCAVCQHDYKPTIEAITAKDRRMVPAMTLDNIPWYYLKRLKEHVPKQVRPEIDHIIPISRGGASLGIDNHQAICYGCHKAKSKIDNSGPRRKK